MADYKFDGQRLKLRGTTIANISGNNIRKGSGGSIVANIRDSKIRSGSGG